MKGGQQQQQNSAGLDSLYIAGFIVILAIIVWWKFKAQLIGGIFSIKLVEIDCIEFFLDSFSEIASWLNMPQPDVANMERWVGYMHSANPQDVSLQELSLLMSDVGAYIAIPVFIVSLMFGCMLFFYHSANMYNRIYDMSKLRSTLSRVWPQFSPVLNKNLIATGLDEGHWRMSEQPMGFCKKHKILEEYRENSKLCARVIRPAAAEIFALQMGPIWDSRVDTQPPYIQALFSIFAAKAERDTSSAVALLDQISRSALSTKLDFSGSRELLRKHIRSKLIGRAAGPHAYVLTMMASMLELARSDGVLATAEFLWLKAVDRRLWYMLNSVGRKTAFPEVGGPFAHWLIEKRLRRPLKVPVVNTAVDALEDAISQIVYHRDED